jgi:hypothetical protein
MAQSFNLTQARLGKRLSAHPRRPAVLANIGKTVNYQNDVVAAFAPPKAV